MAAGRHDNAEAIETLVKKYGVEVDAKDDVSAKISSYSDILVLKAQAMGHNAIGDHGIAGVCPEGEEMSRRKLVFCLRMFSALAPTALIYRRRTQVTALLYIGF